jgi:NADPH:quinone reductase-like Zn-dependent oxidoreductase
MRNANAWIVDEPNGRFRETNIPLPTLRPNEVLVRIAAAAVNPIDIKIRAGKAEHAKQPLPAILGVDMAGRVDAVGSAVMGFQPGDEVYGMAGGVGGHQGTLAQFLAADSDLIARKPASLSMRQAAALPLSVITAWEGLVDRASVRANQTVLVHGGTGGVGHIAIQIARAFGARVFTTVSADKSQIVGALGAQPIDYRAVSIDDYVSKFTTGHGFDIVFDTVGGATLDGSFTAVRRYTGHVVSSLGWGSHSLAPLSFRGASYSGVFTLRPLITGQDRKHHGLILASAAKLAEEGKLTPLLNSQLYSTSDLEAAFVQVERGSLGKVVVDIPN